MIKIKLGTPADYPLLENWGLHLQKGDPRVIVGDLKDGLRLFDQWLSEQRKSSGIAISGTSPIHTESLCLHDEWALLERIRKDDDSEFIEGGYDPGPSLEDVILDGQCRPDDFPELTERFGITPLLKSPFRFLSNGEIRKALLVRALIKKPDLLILSSPFEGLDREWRSEINKILEEKSKDFCLLFLIQRRRDWPEWIESGYEFSRVETPKHITKDDSHPKIPKAQTVIVPNHLLNLCQPEFNDEDALVDIRDLNIRYGARLILKNFSWRIHQGENWLVTGRNGMGKTTLMDVVYADHDQSYGQDFSLFGIKRGTGESIWDLRRHMGRVNVDSQRRIQNDQPVLAMVTSGLEDTLGLRRDLLPQEKKLATEWLELLGIVHLRDRYCHQLDYGDLRTVLMARALIKVPRLLILDEPSQGLTQEQHEKIVSVVGHILKHCPCSVLYVTHHPKDAPLPFSHHLELMQTPEGYSKGLIHHL